MSHLNVWWADDSNTPLHPQWGDSDYESASTGNADADWTLVRLSIAVDRLLYRVGQLEESACVLTVEARGDLDRVRDTAVFVEFLLWRAHRQLDTHGRPNRKGRSHAAR